MAYLPPTGLIYERCGGPLDRNEAMDPAGAAGMSEASLRGVKGADQTAQAMGAHVWDDGELSEGIPHEGSCEGEPPTYLITTAGRLSRSIAVRSFGEDQVAAATMFSAGSKIDGRIMFAVDVASQAVTELRSWAIVSDSARQECVGAAKRWAQREEYRRQVRTEAGGKEGFIMVESDESSAPRSPGIFRGKSNIERELKYIGIRGSVLLVSNEAPQSVSLQRAGTLHRGISAPQKAFPAHNLMLSLPKSSRSQHPHAFCIHVRAQGEGAKPNTFDAKLTLAPETREERDEWIVSLCRAGAKPDRQSPELRELREKAYKEAPHVPLPPGGMMGMLSVKDKKGPHEPWEDCWFEWRFPHLTQHKGPGSEPMMVLDLDSANCEVFEDSHLRAFSWQLSRDTSSFESDGFMGSLSDSVAWLALAADNTESREDWIRALQVR